MKKTLTLLTMTILSLTTYSQCSELFFSEYMEGSSSNKSFEIYNPSASVIDLSDYVVYRNNNGSSIPTDSLFTIGLLNPGDVFITANPSASAAIIAESDTTHTMTFYNGDDALYLKKISTGDTLDIIGVIGTDPGSGWPVGSGATNNFTLVRNISIQQGITDWTIGATQWDVFPIDMVDSLGAHTMIACCQMTNATITETACNSYTSPSGNYVWTISDTYFDTISNVNNCDSVITIELTINTVNSSVTQNGATLTATQIGATYQWLNCPTMTAIASANNQTFTSTTNGEYAVIVTNNGCTDTSTCYMVSGVGINENGFGNDLVLFPNPTTGVFTIELSPVVNNATVVVYTVDGQNIINKKITSNTTLINLDAFENGIYIVNIINGDYNITKRITKK
jgi:hypothetical protein